MNESFDQARHVVTHLRREGFKLTLDGGAVAVDPLSSLNDNQHRMLQERLVEVKRFLACESAVERLLYVKDGGMLT